MSLRKKCPYSGFFWSDKQTKKTPNTALFTQCVFCLLNYTYQKIEQHQNRKESKKKKKKREKKNAEYMWAILFVQLSKKISI